MDWFRRHRLTVMRVVAALAGIFFLSVVVQAISPWGPVTLSNTSGVTDVNLHRWSAALAGGPDVGLGALLVYIAWRPVAAPLALQWVALAVIVFLGANVPFVGPLVAVIAIPVVLVLLLYPEQRKLLIAPWRDGVDLPLLALGVVIAIFLLVAGATALVAQAQGGDELARNYDWASNGEHLINVALAAALAGMRRPGSVAVGIMAGLVLAFLGAAAITVPTDPGSFGTVGGALAVAAGLALAALTAYRSMGSQRRPTGVTPQEA
jgi:hypothetical protein